MENQQPTNQEILEAINIFSSHVDQRFDNLEGRVLKIENKVGTIENKINGIENTMVTKIYLDDKLADL